MKKLFALFILLFISNLLPAQNLVLNGSFEDTVSCPTTIGQIQKCEFWMNPTAASPDYFHTCTGIFPLGLFGTQLTHSGEAFAGVSLGIIDPSGVATVYREYIEGTLISPLVAGTCYYFEMYANLGHVNHTTDDIQVYFSDTIISGIMNGINLPVNPQIINTPGNILDTLNWTLISGEFEAMGGESYFIIGNFLSNVASSYIVVDNTTCCDAAYCYIDDVLLIPTVCTALEDVNENISVTIFPNPVIDQVNINVNSNEYSEVVFYDILSQKVLSQSFIKSVSVQVNALSKGVYLYEVKNKFGSIKTGKIIIL